MKKYFMLVCIVLWLVASCSILYGYDRYEYNGTDYKGKQYYVDTQSIVYADIPNHFRFWYKVLNADLGVNNRLSQFAYTLICIEVNFAQNTYRFVEDASYNANGHLVDSYVYTQIIWNNIVPNSIMENLCNVVKRIIQNNTRQSRSQQFATPQAQPHTLQPKAPLSNQEQREEYSKLLEYVSWLIAQPDYPEFDAWVARKAQQAGVSISDVNAGIQEYIRLSGGKYSDIRAVLASWYREFYMERYGGQR